jgi:hypothetical protein
VAAAAGGGAGATGNTAATSWGYGGNGIYNSDFGWSIGGGGGGGTWSDATYNSGDTNASTLGYGGSQGARYNVYAGDGTGGTGSGGGGGGNGGLDSGRGGSGGSGRVGIRYAGGQKASGGDSIYSSGGYTYHIFYNAGTLSIYGS